MHHTGNLLSDGFLQQPHMRALLVLLDQFPYGRLVQKGKGFNIVFGIFIRGVQPILVKLVGRGSGFVQPNIAAFGFSEFCSVSLSDQRTGDGKGFATQLASDQFCSCSDITPLITPPICNLQSISL